MSGGLTFRSRDGESHQGCRRRPKAKSEIGGTPAEPIIATAADHTCFGPRIWLAGRRSMSMSAATRRAPSAMAGVISSRRVRSLDHSTVVWAWHPPRRCVHPDCEISSSHRGLAADPPGLFDGRACWVVSPGLPSMPI